MRLREGDRVDRYVIVGPLGSGGMGDVYRARDTRLDRLIALKVLLPRDKEALGSDGLSLGRRMLREAHAVAALEHPNVVAVYDVGEVAWEGVTLTYIAMELIQGAPLRAHVGDSSIPIGTRVRWLLDVARALAAAHAAGIIHRDVKPENVMVRADGTVKVLDFGIAKRAPTPTDTTLRTETAEGVRVGTPYYMAPEQMRGEAIDARADQFSWGVLAYEVLCGHRPWTDDGDAVQLIAQLLSKPTDPPRKANPEIPEHVSAVVARALEKNPADRFPSMAAVVSEIESAPDVYAPTISAIPIPKVRVSSPSLGDAAPLSTTAHANITTAKRRAASVPDASPDARPRGPRRTAVVLTLAALTVAATAATGVWMGRRYAEQGATRAPVAAAGCTSNAGCSRAHDGKPYVCHRDDGSCAALESQDCKVYADPRALESDETIWVGAMFQLTGPDAEGFRAELEGVDLARRDFVEVLGGIVASKQARPIGIVGCDDYADASRAAHHLVEQARVPAVIGFGTSQEVIDLAPALFLPKGVLMLVADGGSPLIAAIPQPDGPRLLWRTVYSGQQLTKSIRAYVEWLGADRRRAGGSGAPLRVAHVRSPTTVGTALTSELLALSMNPSASRAIETHELLLDPAGGSAAMARVVDALLTLRPDVVVSESPPPFEAVVETVEDRWAGGHRPLYVTIGFVDEIRRFAGANRERRHRFFAVSNASNTPTNLALAAHFNGVYADRVGPTDTPNSAYDAFYLVAYAAIAGGSKPVSGATLAGGIARLLPPGPRVDVGPLGILHAYKTLSSGGHLDLNGAIGRLDLDPATGDGPVDMAILCIGADDAGVESGLTYDADRDVVVGTLRCP